jgi:hypothetical protein
MKGKVFFARNLDGCKLSFTNIRLNDALYNINKSYDEDDYFFIIKYIIIKNPKKIRDYISKKIIDKRNDNNLYDITDDEITSLFDEVRNEFISNKYSEERDSSGYNSGNDPEYILDENIIDDKEEELDNNSNDNNSNNNEEELDNDEELDNNEEELDNSNEEFNEELENNPVEELYNTSNLNKFLFDLENKYILSYADLLRLFIVLIIYSIFFRLKQ